MSTLRYSLVLLFSIISFSSFSQNSIVNIYNPNADAKADIAAAVKKAKAENKHVLLQIGGNWCPWCVKMHKLFESDSTINKALHSNYVFVMVNYSKENKNLPLLKELEFPQRFGFPSLVVLNQEGKRIHTQATGLLESGDGYDHEKIKGFLKSWTVKALDPASYPEK